MEKIIKIGNADVRLRASALVPRMYRFAFGSDLIVDVSAVRAAMQEQDTDRAEFTTIVENLAWTMARAADKDGVPDSVEEWLDKLDWVLSLYHVSTEVMQLWFDSCNVTSTPAKK